MSLMQCLGNAARDGALSSEMGVGALDHRGPVMMQIKRQLQALKFEPPVPAYVPVVEPWGRYKAFELEVKKNFKGKDLFENEHPLASRELAIFYQNEKYVDRASRIRSAVTRPKASMLTWSKRFECSAFWSMMPLLEIDGRLAPGAAAKVAGETSVLDKPGASDVVMSVQAGENAVEPVSNVSAGSSESNRPHPPPDPDEVKEIAQTKTRRLHETIMTVAMNGPSAHHHSSAEEALGSIIFGTPRGSMKTETPKDPSYINEKEPVLRREKQVASSVAGPSSAHKNNNDSVPSQAHADLKREVMRCEKEALKAKLAWAQAEMTKLVYEQKALEAKMHYAKVEVEMIRNCLEAYEDNKTSM